MITFPTYDAVDLFAGPGGWSLAAKRLGLREMGIELDQAAHMTRRAAGFHTVRASVTELGPANFPNARGLIGSPPCQPFSAAGNGAGRKQLGVVLRAMTAMASGAQPDHSEWTDPRTALVLEPLRWVIAAVMLGRPYEWVALEQVPTVLPVWQAMAEHLRDFGYDVAVGNLQAEQYGVPQTRKRAVLVARLHGTAVLPTPTHSRYHTRDKARLDPDVLPWVSMADALGWSGFDQEAQTGAGMLARSGRTERATRTDGEPSFTITGSGEDHTGKMGGCARLRMRSNYGTGGDAANRGERGADEPAATVTSKVDRNRWQMASGTRPNAATRVQDEPSPTLAFGHDSGSYVWTPEGMTPAEVVDYKLAARFGNQDHSAVRSVDEPAATIRYGARANSLDWVNERPATTVQGDPRIAEPGHKDRSNGGQSQFTGASVRVSVVEAAMLQSFPVDFPWQGTKTKQYQQVGNAIPPLLAEAILRAVI